MDDTLQQLYKSLDERWMPEDIAELILDLGGLTEAEQRILDAAARYSFRRTRHQWSSMLRDFRRPKDMAHQVEVVWSLLDPALGAPLMKEHCGEPEAVEELVEQASTIIHKAMGRSDFKTDRLDRKARAAQGLGEMSRRRYNKVFRLLGRMESRLGRLRREIRMREFQQTSKSGLAYRISWEDFQADPVGGAFVAYYAAALNRRSMFTVESQRRGFDAAAKMLLERAERNPTTNWEMIAHVSPDPHVLSRLSREAQGRLVGEWYSILDDIATDLRAVWEKSHIDRTTMIVQRGDDSTTWNILAGAWNKARSHWVSLLHATGTDAMLDVVCPGKVLRLMAADVARWHRAVKGDNALEPDTAVWTEVPLPWEVVSGAVRCRRSEVEQICAKYRIDPVAKGWTGAKVRAKNVEDFVPTPELVHGVAVSSPALARVLRKAGWFSGKEAHAVDVPVVVVRDQHGAAVGAVELEAIEKVPDVPQR